MFVFQCKKDLDSYIRRSICPYRDILISQPLATNLAIENWIAALEDI